VVAPKVVLRRRIDAPPSKVYAACTRAELLGRWFGPKGFFDCQVAADARVGGRFALRMLGPRGFYGAEGVYREVVPGARIVMTWRCVEAPAGEAPDPFESLVTFDLRPDGEGTLLTLIHEGLADEATAESAAASWRHELDKLTTLVGRDKERTAARTSAPCPAALKA
jgi:uncharacterized protein YndB with AHSA1/START domain